MEWRYNQMPINRRLRWFLENLIRCEDNDKRINQAIIAIRIIERGLITESEMQMMEKLGFKH